MPYFLKRILPKRLTSTINKKAVGIVDILPYGELTVITGYAAKYRMMAYNNGSTAPADTAEALVALAPVKLKIMMTSDNAPQQHVRLTLYKCRRVCSDDPGPIASDAWANENDFELPYPTTTTDEVDVTLFSDMKQNARVREFFRPVARRNVTLVHGQTRTINMVALPRRYLQSNYLHANAAYQNGYSFVLVFEVTGSPVHGDIGGGVLDSVMSPTSLDCVVELVEGFKFRPLSRVSLAVDNDLDDEATNLEVMNLFGTATDVPIHS